MVRAVIVDDEPRALESLRIIVERFFPEVALVGEASCVEQAYEVINKVKPNTVFLDIKMPDGSGFDLLNRFERVDFKVIFTTAFEEYALEAIKFSALDYILKPINTNDLRSAIEKLKPTIGEEDDLNTKLKAYFANLQSSDPMNKKVVLKTNESIHLIKLSHIVRCESECNYTWFYFDHQPRLLISKSLKFYEDLLQEYGFVRVHQSHLINLNHVQRIDKLDGGSLLMTDRSHIPISARRREQLYRVLENL